MNVGKQCVANDVHLTIAKIYNQTENTVLRTCLLNRASTVLTDNNYVYKNVLKKIAVNCYDEVNEYSRNSFGFCQNVHSMQRNTN